MNPPSPQKKIEFEMELNLEELLWEVISTNKITSDPAKLTLF